MEKQKTIYLLRGLQGSGKSTWARKQIIDNPGKYKRVSKDDFRVMLDSGRWSRENEQFILKIRDEVIRESLIDGYDVIVDDTNFAPKHKLAMEQIVGSIPNTVLVEKFFDLPLEDCIFRDSKRPRPVGAVVIRKTWSDYLKPVPVAYIDGVPECICVDIDGTIADKGSRSAYDETKVLEDKPIRSIIDLVQTYKISKEIDVILVSGRHESCREDTEKWLEENGVPFDALYMRPVVEGQDEPDTVIKKKIYEDHIKGKYNVLWVVDDRKRVIDMWRNLGLKVLDCGDGVDF